MYVLVLAQGVKNHCGGLYGNLEIILNSFVFKTDWLKSKGVCGTSFALFADSASRALESYISLTSIIKRAI